MKEMVSKSPHFGRKLKLDYGPCTDSKGKISDYSQQILNQLLGITTHYFSAMDYVENFPKIPIRIAAERKFVKQWKSTNPKSHLLMMCEVGPRLKGVLEKFLLSVKLVFRSNNRTVTATQEWFDY